MKRLQRGTQYLLRHFLSWMPLNLRSHLIRRMIVFPTVIDQDLRFKIAETEGELEQAFSILHDAYVREGLMTPHASGMRVTKYHALPSTTTLIALQGDLVVGTLSLVRKSHFGLPLEAIYDVDNLASGSRIAEVSSLAIRSGFQKQQGRILFPLLKFMYHYCTEYFGVSHLLIAVNPKWFDFYQSVLLFSPLKKRSNLVESYDFVNGAPAMGGILDLKQAYRDYQVLYSRQPRGKNLFHFFCLSEKTGMSLPVRQRGHINDSILTPALMKHFFCEKSDTFKSLSDFEKTILRNMFDIPDCVRLIPAPAVSHLNLRRQKRYELNLQGTVQVNSRSHGEVEIQTVGFNSLDGNFGTELSGIVASEFQANFLIDTGDSRSCHFSARILRIDGEGRFAAYIQKPPTEWFELIRGLEERLLAQPRIRLQLVSGF